jgi:hypothetical protein
MIDARIPEFGSLLGGGAALLAATFATMVAAGPAQAQQLHVVTQTSLSVSCNEPGCDCIDANGAPAACPATEVRNYDSGNVPLPTSDSHTATVSGTFVGFDSTGMAGADLHGDAAFGTLEGSAHAESAATGTYVAAGGLAIPGTANAYVSVGFDDYLIAHAAAPGGLVMLSFSPNTTTSSHSASVSGSGVSFDPCLSNGEARAQLDVGAAVAPLGGGSGGGNVGYDRTERECGAAQVTGTPGHTFNVVAHDGERVNFGQSMILNVTAVTGGGPGTIANRGLGAGALLDALSTSKFYIEVLSPGASYLSGSGTVYDTPEPNGAGSAVAAVAALAALRRAHRQRG